MRLIFLVQHEATREQLAWVKRCCNWVARGTVDGRRVGFAEPVDTDESGAGLERLPVYGNPSPLVDWQGAKAAMLPDGSMLVFDAGTYEVDAALCAGRLCLHMAQRGN